MLTFFEGLSKAIRTVISDSAPDLKEVKETATDGANCDPKHHHVLFEDPIIRIIDVLVNPQEIEPFHTHERCAVMYVDMPANITVYIKDQDPIVVTNPDRRFNIIPSEGAHRVENNDNKQYRAFRIEIKADICSLANFGEISNSIQALIKSKQKALNEYRKIMLAQEKSGVSLLWQFGYIAEAPGALSQPKPEEKVTLKRRNSFTL